MTRGLPDGLQSNVKTEMDRGLPGYTGRLTSFLGCPGPIQVGFIQHQLP